MANYTTQLGTWPNTGVAPPTDYAFEGGVQPVDAYDNFVTYNTIEDIKHLISLTNTRLESEAAASYPASPEDGHLLWNTGSSALEVYDSGAATWNQVAFGTADLDAHVADTANPHAVTAAQAGAIEDAAGAVTETNLAFDPATQAELDAHVTDLNNPHSVDATDVGALPITGGTMAGKIDLSQFDLCNIVVDPRATDPSTPTAGQIWYRTDTNVWRGYNGTSTVEFTTTVV